MMTTVEDGVCDGGGKRVLGLVMVGGLRFPLEVLLPRCPVCDEAVGVADGFTLGWNILGGGGRG